MYYNLKVIQRKAVLLCWKEISIRKGGKEEGSKYIEEDTAEDVIYIPN